MVTVVKLVELVVYCWKPISGMVRQYALRHLKKRKELEPETMTSQQLDKFTTGKVKKNNQTTGQTGQLHLLEDEQQQKRTFHAEPNEARSAHTEPKATK